MLTIFINGFHISSMLIRSSHADLVRMNVFLKFEITWVKR